MIKKFFDWIFPFSSMGDTCTLSKECLCFACLDFYSSTEYELLQLEKRILALEERTNK